jgi:hypothetical protein
MGHLVCLGQSRTKFRKNENQQFKYPIFQMRQCECTHDHRHEWLELLFSGLDFDEQWEELGRRLG